MRDMIQLAGLLALITLLVVAAAIDLRRRRIPNPLCIAIAVLSLPYWAAADPHVVPRVITQIIVCGAASMLLIGLFAARMLGGGDVKLMAALCLWLPAQTALSTMVAISLAGGVVAILMLAHAAVRGSSGKPRLPYAVAIMLGSLPAILPRLWVIIERL